MNSPRRDLAIGGVGGGPSLLNFIESTLKRLQQRSPRTGILLENPLLGGGKNGAPIPVTSTSLTIHKSFQHFLPTQRLAVISSPLQRLQEEVDERVELWRHQDRPH